MYYESDERLIKVIPTERQIEHQKMEFYGFIHFTLNTFTHREWGDGTESPKLFNLQTVDVKQWVETAVKTGMKGLILTCKHHDGFCLWPSQYTKHSIAAAPYKDGHGDIVKELSEECRRAGIKFGIYFSPWDRNHPSYGYGESYNNYFVNQLTELLSNYGEIFEVWFDGACGEGKNGKKQLYDWDRYYEMIRKLQPGACISICGPDVRWCGNEAGQVRPSEWSVVPQRLCQAERVIENSQHEDNAEFQQKKLSSQDLDLGSRRALEGEEDLIWYPAEVDTSCRPGWFYNPENNGKAYSTERLIEIYLSSVGGNAMLLLNMPPDDTGKIPEYDREQLLGLGRFIQTAFKNNLLKQARLSVSQQEKGYEINHVRDEWDGLFYKTTDKITQTTIIIEWEREHELTYLVLKERIQLSQRIEAFLVYAEMDNKRALIYTGTTVGYKKIVDLKKYKTKKLTIEITDARVAPTLEFIGVYE